MKDLPWNPNLSWVFVLQALKSISSVEGLGIRHAHQTTVVVALTDKLHHFSSPKS
jgi:hypothetical protein